MKKNRGFTLIEMLVVVAIIALLISILLPSLQKARELSRTTKCTANVKSIGTTCYIYQGDNLDKWPTAGYNTMPNTNNQPIIQYMENMGGGQGTPEDPDRITMSISGDEGSTKVSTTRSFWLLIRSGEIIPANFLCPSSDDTVDPTIDVTTYWDFVGFGTASYGYQIPYDDANTCKPSADVDPRMVLVADRGPWSAQSEQEANSGVPPNQNDIPFFVDTEISYAPELHELLTGATGTIPGPTEDSTPDDWKRFNSPNHGGPNQGRGQNMLYPDAHAQFKTDPLGGVDSDNVYTQMNTSQGEGQDFRQALQWGEYPKLGTSPIYPGDNSLSGFDALTDSLIWP